MKNISERKLKTLGFIKEFVLPKESGQEKKYHYFTFNVKGQKSILISCASDECVDGRYDVEFFDYPELGKYYDIKVLRNLVKCLKSGEKA